MTNIIIVAVILVIIGLAIGYIVKAKKSGQKCIGCPSAKECDSKNCNCGCSSDKKTSE